MTMTTTTATTMWHLLIFLYSVIFFFVCVVSVNACRTMLRHLLHVLACGLFNVFAFVLTSCFSLISCSFSVFCMYVLFFFFVSSFFYTLTCFFRMDIRSRACMAYIYATGSHIYIHMDNVNGFH